MACGWNRVPLELGSEPPSMVIGNYRYANAFTVIGKTRIEGASQGWRRNEHNLIEIHVVPSGECSVDTIDVATEMVSFVPFFFFIRLNTMGACTENKLNSLRSLVPIPISMMKLFSWCRWQTITNCDSSKTAAHSAITFTDSKLVSVYFGSFSLVWRFRCRFYYSIDFIDRRRIRLTDCCTRLRIALYEDVKRMTKYYNDVRINF